MKSSQCRLAAIVRGKFCSCAITGLSELGGVSSLGIQGLGLWGYIGVVWGCIGWRVFTQDDSGLKVRELKVEECSVPVDNSLGHRPGARVHSLELTQGLPGTPRLVHFRLSEWLEDDTWLPQTLV